MRNRKLLVVVTIGLALTVGLVAGRQLAKMGNTDSSGGPGDAASQSYTLEDLYDRLATGVLGTKSTFEEPTDGPLTGTMHTLDQIMALVPDLKDSFSGSEGTRVIPIPAGLYRGGKTVTGVDSDLVAENIMAGVTIFGVTGSNTTCVECTGMLSAGGRWCDNGDGTVTDMTNGLVWLEDASWGEEYPWRGLDSSGATPRYQDAFWRASQRGVAWRLPTELEMAHLYLDPEGISRSDPISFDNIQDGIYWTATSDDIAESVTAWGVDFSPGQPASDRYSKDQAHHVWPVHAGQP
ncbi:DUF1566 domain-containing protein [Candidatus Bipolaricaulota bacterium]